MTRHRVPATRRTHNGSSYIDVILIILDHLDDINASLLQLEAEC